MRRIGIPPSGKALRTPPIGSKDAQDNPLTTVTDRHRPSARGETDTDVALETLNSAHDINAKPGSD